MVRFGFLKTPPGGKHLEGVPGGRGAHRVPWADLGQMSRESVLQLHVYPAASRSPHPSSSDPPKEFLNPPPTLDFYFAYFLLIF